MMFVLYSEQTRWVRGSSWFWSGLTFSCSLSDSQLYVHKQLTFTWCKPGGKPSFLLTFYFWVNGGNVLELLCSQPEELMNLPHLYLQPSLYLLHKHTIVGAFCKVRLSSPVLGQQDVLCSFSFFCSGLLLLPLSCSSNNIFSPVW